jgi:hypothetical protein
VCSLPGADRIAINTGATVIGNGEAINVLRAAGVPEHQLVPVSGGERVPLFPDSLRRAAVLGEVERAPGPPGAPPLPKASLAVASVHVWPSLHCLMPGNSHADVPEVMDTGKVELSTVEALMYHSLTFYSGVHWRLQPVCLHLGHHVRHEVRSAQDWRTHA